MANAVRAAGWSACRWRTALVVVGACLGPTGALQAQATARDCGISTDWRTCVLQAGNIGDIATTAIGGGEREIRFWWLSGGAPDNLLTLRQRGDSIAGQLFLIWPAFLRGDGFVKGACQQQWWNDLGGVCLARLSAPRNWRDILAQLDEAGMEAVPATPVPHRPCPQPDTVAGQPRRERLCPILFDGGTYILEVRTLTTYWRYRFPPFPDTLAPGYRRNERILNLLTCVSQKRGDGPCLEDRRP